MVVDVKIDAVKVRPPALCHAVLHCVMMCHGALCCALMCRYDVPRFAALCYYLLCCAAL